MVFSPPMLLAWPEVPDVGFVSVCPIAQLAQASNIEKAIVLTIFPPGALAYLHLRINEEARLVRDPRARSGLLQWNAKERHSGFLSLKARTVNGPFWRKCTTEANN